MLCHTTHLRHVCFVSPHTCDTEGIEHNEIRTIIADQVDVRYGGVNVAKTVTTRDGGNSIVVPLLDLSGLPTVMAAKRAANLSISKPGSSCVAASAPSASPHVSVHHSDTRAPSKHHNDDNGVYHRSETTG